MSQDVAPSVVRLNVLGSFRLEIDGRRVRLPVQSRRVLGFLAVGERPVTRATVAGRLWAEYPEKTAHARLRTALWRIRRLAEDSLLGYDDSLELDPTVDVDLHRARECARRLNEAEIDSFGAAIDLLRFDLLPSWDEDWLTMDRERLRQDRLHALERLGSELTRLGRHCEAIDSAMTAVAIEPLRESAQLTLLEAHLGEGNVSEALRQYHSYRELLLRELGIDPGERVMTLVGPYIRRGH